MGSVLAGIGWHVLGAAMAATFYVPLERVKKWSWETTWSVAGLFSWILLPIGVSLALLPDFHGFYASMGWPLLVRVALFGALWGVGGITYGLTIRHLGLSLGIGMAIGLTLIVGTLLPPLERVRHIQALKRTDPALAVADARPEFVHLAAERGDGANTRDDDAAFHASSQAEDASVLSMALPIWSTA